MSWAAASFNEKTFLQTLTGSVSFTEIRERALRFATGMHKLGIVPGDRVTLWMENGWQWIASYFAVLELGAIVNPINILLTAEEVAFIAADCGAKVLITNSHHAPALAQRLSITSLQSRNANDKSLGVARLEDLLAEAPRESEFASTLGSDNPAVIGYTSGTTGRPRGAVLTHRNIVTNALMTALMHGRTSRDVVVSSLPCSHVYGNIVMISSLAAGATLALLPRFDEPTILDSISKYRATMFEGVPTMYMKLLSHAELNTTDLTSLRICTVGGQTMPLAMMEAVERVFGCRLIELWGMTELAGLGTTHPHNGPRKLGSIGIPLPLMEIKVVCVEDPRKEVETDSTGELVIRGPVVMQGYYGTPSASEETILPGGWLRTGDLVRRDRDGYLFAVDRLKEVIINGGYNVYPAEVEQIIAQLDSVAMVAVAAAKDALKGQVPKAFIVLKAGAKCDALAVISHCKTRLASYKVPVAVAFVSDLPRNSTGKILRRVLAESKL
jgi:long-chain acyl-CoA synthetase